MDPNILISQAPSSVMVGGVSVPIRTGYRYGIQVMRLIDDPRLPEAALPQLILANLYASEGDPSPVSLALSSPQEAIDAALDWFNLNEPKRPLTAKQERAARMRTWDWDFDARYVIADFQRDYGIDLTDPETQMHWWRFWSLFRGLGDTSITMHVMAVRAAETSSDMSSEQIAEIREQQRRLMLPARTEEEARRNRLLRWGDNG